jgi:hypothetical protein
MKGFLDFTLVKKMIDRFGESVDLEVYTAKTYSDYGDPLSQTTTYYDVKAIFNTYGLKQNFVGEGQFVETRESFFFDGAQSGIIVDNIIVRSNGERWKINKATNHCVEGRTMVQEASVSNS